jgi:hypothetical protein
MSRGVKIDVKLAAAGTDAFASLVAELAGRPPAVRGTGASVTALELASVTGVTAEPASVSATVATAESVRPRR